MKYLFHIFHSEQNKSPLEQQTEPFDEEAEARAYDLLPTYLRLRFSGSADTVTCKAPTDGSPGLVVEISSESGQDDVDERLAHHIVALNKSTKGLCLGIDRLWPGMLKA